MSGLPERLLTEDGIPLLARWWVPEGAPNAAVVLTHGFASSVEDAAVSGMAAHLSAGGFLVLTYDSRGHGRSGGVCTLGDEERFDVAAAADAAAATGLPVVTVGASMGAIATLRAVAGGLAEPDAVVTVSSPARWKLPVTPTGIGSVLLTRTWPGRWAADRVLRVRVGAHWRWPAAPEHLASRVRIPLGVVHGRSDRFISAGAAALLSAAAAGPSKVWLVAGMGHAFCPAGRREVISAVDWALSQARSVLGPALAS